MRPNHALMNFRLKAFSPLVNKTCCSPLMKTLTQPL